MRQNALMASTLATFFYDPSCVPVFFAIDAMLALVGRMIATM